MLKVYNNFWSFTYHVGKEISLDGHNIYNEIKSAIDAYESS
jgi:hypothetical protein